ncbi:hypothetical protein [Mycobacteroides abscessus]|uniref:hypothetical protein n=1 Tax=Mycobacteroides abscessus TaxID=36809 RepID=UPI00092639DA|nr:hypothetical protein [Mycobacteroides abscessus]MDM1896005.1 hypothetical protein [Mycobacteroides abscessus]MDM1905312.1 hypothetical protein [Mycobacteroides abscessus]MDM1910836.1 hypothetical protein [Mycobacteroides abscessus]MDM1919893.1 hypothetical protein [Mycobacteroides abscessus]MDM2097581.1 hypothetical protein [Mycobacteroides abscessus]
MRLNSRNFTAMVTAEPHAVRPIRLRCAGITYSLSTAEAMDLAHQIVDTISEINHRKETP